MKKSFITLFKMICLAIILTGFSNLASAQTVLYSTNFDTKDTLNFPKLPADWTANTTDSNWTLDHQKPSVDTQGASGHFNLFVDTKTSHLGKDAIVTLKSISTVGYKKISLMWHERVSTNLLSYKNVPRADYSVDGGKTWDSIPHSWDYTASALWMKTNKGVPIILPAKAENITGLQIRFVLTVVAAHGNYGIDDLMIKGNKFTAVEEVKNANKTISVYPNPATTLLTISGLKSGNPYFVADLTGKTFTSGISTGQSQIIDLSVFPKGIYFFSTTLEGQRVTKKFIVQ
jgi:hypothetical protein